ncbi:NRDE family protein [Roseococcus sp. SDR]|uniref:NRDE family protein n=1 Tax=Roseococcus sp. SDR TaxID=2835532 RepID=UPI001BCE520C|nr:NRDE family protein [Roseococcus sp. SDR]MBS7792083.1 NRDE family protein [Roseococcus sp. SDR]MBV1847397.1 NRDE family protein [Roseococcus sp. SDR]
MCTVILLRRPGADWPLLLAANRDERLDRAWEAPAEHWPGLIGGRDTLAGGTWMAMNRHGVVCAVLNRVGSLGPDPAKRSRGALPLIALEEASAGAAAARIAALDAGQWRPFNLVLADAKTAWFLPGLGAGQAVPEPLPEGVSMVTAHPPNDVTSPRTARHLPRFRAATQPSPPDWGGWPALLADSDGATAEALNVPPIGGFGTVCSSLLALGSTGARIWLFAPGPPDRTDFAPVPL